MARSLNQKYFGNRNVGTTGTSDDKIGGEGIASVNFSDAGSWMAVSGTPFSGLVLPTPTLPGGVQATATCTIVDGRISTVTITNPGTNSYKRLVPGFEAPVKLAYSARNRSACIRIPITGSSPKAKRVEFRCPDPSSNPYLAFAAMLMAGIDGIINKIEPPAPVDKDLYELTGAEAAAIPQVPGSLDEVLNNLERDHEFLLKGGVFTKDLIETWIEFKRKQEVDYVRLRPHPAEFELYFDI